jgi:hypothetical protein
MTGFVQQVSVGMDLMGRPNRAIATKPGLATGKSNPGSKSSLSQRCSPIRPSRPRRNLWGSPDTTAARRMKTPEFQAAYREARWEAIAANHGAASRGRRGICCRPNVTL